MNCRAALLTLLTITIVVMAPAAQAEVKKRDTIASLEKKDVEIRSGKIILNSTDLARDSLSRVPRPGIG